MTSPTNPADAPKGGETVIRNSQITHQIAELVGRLRIMSLLICRESADALEQQSARIAELEAALQARDAQVEELREALQAAVTMWRTPKPVKLDAALSWRENDEKAERLIAAALGAPDKETKNG